MSDILRDVDEMMKADRMSQLWQEHGKTVLTLIGLIILATAFNSGWTAYKNNKAEDQTSQILEALQDKDQYSALRATSEKLDGAGKGFSAMNAAALAVKDGKLSDAISLYDSVIADSSLPQDLRDLASVQKTSILLDESPELSAEGLMKILQPVLDNSNSVWRLRALMVSSVIKAHKLSDYQGALEDLALLSADNRLPPSMSSQVSALQKVYQSQASKIQSAPAE
ncbi:MAG: tetratricopeptide repeat protein [Alphaproteobacteria bacterium]|nr:tetratricopeptide repeat protein [Alphaproteobacteria bacterium]